MEKGKECSKNVVSAKEWASVGKSLKNKPNYRIVGFLTKGAGILYPSVNQ